MRAIAAVLLSAALLAPLSAAQAASPQATQGFSVARSSFSAIPAWQQDNQAAALEAFLRSCTKLQNRAPDSIIGTGILSGRADAWQHSCNEAAKVNGSDTQAARAFFEREFVPFSLSYNNNPMGKFTGYYEPLMRGSWEKKGAYQEPVYGKPADLPSGGAVYPLTRSDIDAGALAGKGLERMYIDDAVDLFFLHVQGSGRVLMDTGETVALRFDGKNNQPYTAIGKVLVERGALTAEEVSAPTIRKWLRDHPAQARGIMHHNDSYVFFNVVPEVAGGPVGAQNVPLIPERSLAVDTAFIPLGTPLWLSTHLPQSLYAKGEPYQRLMVAQDKGSAILGAIRGDIFFGFGDRAEDLAGHMNGEGRFVALVPQGIARSINGGNR